MSELRQSERVGEFDSPLGKDVLALARFDGTEGLSELFEYRIELLSRESALDFDPALGRNCTAKFRTPNGAERVFNGVLVEAEWIGAREDLFVYRVVLRPWLWLLSRAADCRIWHETTAIDVITEVFRERGFTDFEKRLSKTYPKLEYCVQYRETDLNFVSRLMEKHGVYYYFLHSEGKHQLVLSDSRSSHERVPGHEKTPYYPGPQSRRDVAHFNGWVPQRRFQTGRHELNDYDFKEPTKDLTGRKEANSNYNKGKLEIFDYPGKYVDRDVGEAYAGVRLDADQARDRRRRATGDAIGLYAGGLTELERHSSQSENIEYLVTHASHSFVLQSYRSGSSGEDDYLGAFELQDRRIPFRAPLMTPKPIVHGPQTARVVGENEHDNAEIDVDKYGRILVLFHWDRKKKKSCRLRVAQVWAGKQWGGQVIPRIGMEAVVEFLEGDPDRPLVVGTVYNGDNRHPYPLPGDKTRSGLKSDSSIGHNGYNEFMFEDRKNAEMIRMHGQKDHEVKILNKETWEIGEKFEGAKSASRSATLVNGGDELTIRAGDRTIWISNFQKTTAGDGIKLICGASVIEMTPTEIRIISGHIALSAPKIDWN